MSHPILVVNTGGTIDKVYFDARSDFEVGASMVGELLREAHVDAPYRIVELLRKDSLDLDDHDRALIAACVGAAPEAAVVITHGTDTMAVTARALQQAARAAIHGAGRSPWGVNM